MKTAARRGTTAEGFFQQSANQTKNQSMLNSTQNKLVPELPPAAAYQNITQDIGIDWFHFETRIRRVILEAVEPLTKKQFGCFEGLEELRRSLKHLYARHDDTAARLDKQVKRNDALDLFERKLKELENELFISRALQRNDNTLVLERVETLQTRLRVAQTDITAVQKLDDKLNKMHQTIFEVTDEYNLTVTNRLKEATGAFIKQVQELDQRYRESQRDL